MLLSKALDEADRMRPNAVHKVDKIRTLHKLEAQIAEMMEIDIPEWDLDDDDPELLAPEAYARLYPLWLMAFIDHEQEEFDLYQADMITANQELADFKAWYRRNHKHKKQIRFTGVFI